MLDVRSAQALQRGRELIERERKPAAQIERRGVVVESQCPDGHGGDYKIGRRSACCRLSLPLTFIKNAMDFLDFVWLVAGFAAPAAAMALGMVLLGRLWGRNAAPALAAPAQAAIQFVVCLAVLMAGLAVTGHDGRMATYGVLVVVAATLQWWLIGRARR